MKGLILQLDPASKTMIVSAGAIPGFMEAMTMPYSVRDAKELDGLKPGTMIDFTLVVEKDYVVCGSDSRPRLSGPRTRPAHRSPLEAAQSGDESVVRKAAGHRRRCSQLHLDRPESPPRSHFAKFAGKVVALNFVYTRCALPNFCYRSSNNFGILQKRFKDRMGRDLILLTVTFDPVHDQPDVLAKYAATWKADPRDWHFLTGSPADIRRVCDLFGEDLFSG